MTKTLSVMLLLSALVACEAQVYVERFGKPADAVPGFRTAGVHRAAERVPVLVGGVTYYQPPDFLFLLESKMVGGVLTVTDDQFIVNGLDIWTDGAPWIRAWSRRGYVVRHYYPPYDHADYLKGK